MSKFKEIYNEFSRYFLLEKNYYYTMPEDKEQLMNDFYLFDLFREEVFPDQTWGGKRRDYPKHVTPGGPTSFEQGWIDTLGMTPGDDPTGGTTGERIYKGPTKRMQLNTKTLWSFIDIRNQIQNELRQHMLDAVFLSLSAEFRHIFARNNSDTLKKFFKWHNLEKAFQSYVEEYNLSKFAGGVFNDRVRRKLDDITGKEKDYTKSRNALLKTGAELPHIVKTMEYAYRGGGKENGGSDVDIYWNSQFGGKPWADIAKAWLALYHTKPIDTKFHPDPITDRVRKATEEEDRLYKAIDDIYDLQHNTSTVFNKVKEYSKDGSYSWLGKALDRKFYASSPWEVWRKASPSIKPMFAEIVKAVHGLTLELFLNDVEEMGFKNADEYDKLKLSYYKGDKERRKKGQEGLPSYDGEIKKVIKTLDKIDVLNLNELDSEELQNLKTELNAISSNWALYDNLPEKLDKMFNASKKELNRVLEKIKEREEVEKWKDYVWKEGRYIVKSRGVWKGGTWKGGEFTGAYGTGGDWVRGTWEGGTWQRGWWMNGIWEKGIWEEGVFYNGIWKDGTFLTGQFGELHDDFNAIWEDGIWEGDLFVNATWKKGLWRKGVFKGSTWEDGIWKGGIFSSGVWKNGTWYGGDWYPSAVWERGYIHDGKKLVYSEVSPREFAKQQKEPKEPITTGKIGGKKFKKPTPTKKPNETE
jgi:hypothetical protein